MKAQNRTAGKKPETSKALTRKEALIHWLQLYEAHLGTMACIMDILAESESINKSMTENLRDFFLSVSARFDMTFFKSINGEEDPDFGRFYKKIEEACGSLEVIYQVLNVMQPQFAYGFLTSVGNLALRARNLINEVLEAFGLGDVSKSIAA